MTGQEPRFILNNREKLRRPAAAAPYAAALLTTAGGMIGMFILLNNDQGHIGVPMLLLDIVIGYWQGSRLGRYLEEQAAAPRAFWENFLSILGRGALTGFLIGFINGAFLLPHGGEIFFTVSIAIGLALGLAIGLLAGLAAGLYLRSLEPGPGGKAAK